MEARFARVADIAQAHLRRVARGARREQIAAPATGFGRGAGRALAVWNPHASGVGEAEGELELDLGARRPAAPPARRGAAAGSRPSRSSLEPGEVAASYTLAASGVAILARGVPHEFMGHVRVRRSRWRGGAGGRRVEVALGAEKPSGFDLEAARRGAARLAGGRRRDAPVTFRALRLPRCRLRFVDALPGCGLRVYRIARGAGARRRPRCARERLPGGGAAIENEQRAPRGARRRIAAPDRSAARRRDRGRAAHRERRRPRRRVQLRSRARRRARGAAGARAREARAGLGGRGLARDRRPLPRARRARAGPRARARGAGSGCRCGCGSGSRAGCRGSRSRSTCDNTARDHRLRAHVRAPFAASRFEVESAFEIATRPIAPAPAQLRERAARRSSRSAPTPQRGFATLAEGSRALSVANRGCAEVEAVPEPAAPPAWRSRCCARSAGSRAAISRCARSTPGPALETPGAQVPGPAPRGARASGCTPTAIRSASPMPTASARRPGCSRPTAEPDAPLRDGARLLEIDDPAVVVSAIEPRAREHAAGPTLQCVGCARGASRLRWRGPGARRLEPVDLRGRATRLEGFAPAKAPAPRSRCAPGRS